MTDLIRILVLLCIITAAVLLAKRLGVLLRPLGLRGRPLKIEEPPMIIGVTNLAQSRVDSGAADPHSRTQAVAFVTQKAIISPIPGRNSTTGYTILSTGPDEGNGEASGLFEIHLYFSLHNWSRSQLSVYDMQARLYHVSAGYAPMSIFYTPRFKVDLCADNSIIGNGHVFTVEDGSAAYFDLAFETGFYDHTGTTLAVFGIDVDFELSSRDGVCKWRIPSDKIYTLRHWGPPHADGSKVYIEHFDGAYLARRYNEERHKVYFMPDTAAAQTMDMAVIYECLGRMFTAHSSRGLHKLS